MSQHDFWHLTFDLQPWPTIPSQPSSRSTYILNIKVVGQTVQPWECPQTDGRYQVHYLPRFAGDKHLVFWQCYFNLDIKTVYLLSDSVIFFVSLFAWTWFRPANANGQTMQMAVHSKKGCNGHHGLRISQGGTLSVFKGLIKVHSSVPGWWCVNIISRQWVNQVQSWNEW